MNVKIIQSAYPRTGSTLLLNIVHGLLQPNEPIYYPTKKHIQKHFITKTHNVDFDTLMRRYPMYQLYFVVSERDKPYPSRYCHYKNICTIPYRTLLETPQRSVEQIVTDVYAKLKMCIPNHVFPEGNAKLHIQNAVKRIKAMNALCERIKDKPFSYWDRFYGIHGSHRNRGKK